MEKITKENQTEGRSEKILLLNEGKVQTMGTYEDITEAGFNIKDILDSFNQANKDNEEKDNKATKFKSEAASPSKISPSKIKEGEKSEARKSESEKKKNENLET